MKATEMVKKGCQMVFRNRRNALPLSRHRRAWAQNPPQQPSLTVGTAPNYATACSGVNI